MAIDLTGISNENEFYTHHYLSAILENDLKDVFQAWSELEKEEDVRQPHARLKGLAGSYFNMSSRFEREKKAAEKLEIQREFLPDLLDVLGYEYQPQIKELEEGVFLPIAGEICRSNGAPELWIVEALDEAVEGTDPLALSVLEEQFPEGQDYDASVLELSLEQVVTKQIFGLPEPPRWVLMASEAQVVLIDRLKWNEKRLLRFDLSEILGRKEDSTLKATTALLHRDSVCPEEGLSLLDTLDENSHKHAFAVSEDLKYALRESIELLGNEAVYYLRENLHEKIYGRELAEQLTLECLRYMYRLLFLFYIESRPELGYAPIKSDAYRMGYSLETLRDLEMVKLTTEESQNGYYIHESIQMLFDLIYNGFPPAKNAGEQFLELEGKPLHGSFQIPPLRSHLFDPNRTSMLNRVRFRNHILQKIIRLMSLSRPKNKKKDRRGRISYAQLGINQLGAVYEALLSYRGFFAETDLYEVKKAGEKYDELETAYFVKAEDLEQYEEEEKVFNDDGTLKMFTKGTFIYRLAGRDRQKSASYYTPEVLTKCLVKYALKELLKDKTADEILHLTVCEPAMGSAAFLNEAINQLAEEYLTQKQKELGETIAHEDYAREKQKVKMFMADNNVFGVDLNPVAVELAEVSLWLNSILEGGFVPWFGMQLVCGNSLIGARRQVFKTDLLKKKQKSDPLWLDEVPERVMPGDARHEDTVYHFLLPDKGMANYTDKVVKEMAQDEIKAINDWRKEFTRPFTKGQIDLLKRLSSAIDKLWTKHTEQLKTIRIRTTDPIYVYGQPIPEKQPPLTTTEYKDRIFNQELLSENVRNSSPYRRLKLAMDYWCAFWFWPILKADLIPTREEFLLDISLILEGNVLDLASDKQEQMSMFPETMPKQLALSMVDEFGYVDVDKLCRENKRLGLVQELADKYHYLHWALEFADLFESRGGFDLALGNPPWIEVHWEEKGLLSDLEPQIALKNLPAIKATKLRQNILSAQNNRNLYFDEFTELTATKTFLTSATNFIYIKGKNNLYKCFICKSWELSIPKGVSAFVNYEGIYSDPKLGLLRKECYLRQLFHFHFENELLLFKDIVNSKKFEINIFSERKNTPQFDMICNLFHPNTIYNSYSHQGEGPVPNIKDNKGWNLKGHKSRILTINDDVIQTFNSLYEQDSVDHIEARLPVIHAIETLNMLMRFKTQETRLFNLADDFFKTPTTCWNEVTSERENIIKRETLFPENLTYLIFSGPHFYVSNPYNKTPRRNCKTNRDYDPIDLTILPDDYIPRANYAPAIDISSFTNKITSMPWNKKQRVNDYYRLIFRAMIGPHAEKTLIGAIIPPGPTHINGGSSYIFKSIENMIVYGSLCSSVPYDCYVKIIGKQNLHDIPLQLPIIYTHKNELTPRYLRLNCLTKYYDNLWSSLWNDIYSQQEWTIKDNRLSMWGNLEKNWGHNTPLRNSFERRYALVEIDVLTSISLGLNLADLITLHNLHCHVLSQYERDTFYDNTGRIVFTINKGLSGIGFSRPEWEDIKNMQHGTVEQKVSDDTVPGGPIERTIVYEAPFDRCDRERDYEIAWTEFEKRFGKTHVKKSQRL